MSGGEYEKIELLLKQFYAKHPFWQEQNRRQAYRLALQPYGYEDIKAAVLRHVRRSTAFPFVGELTAGLAQPEPEAAPETRLDDLDARHVRDVIARFGSWDAYLDKLAGWIEELEAR